MQASDGATLLLRGALDPADVQAEEHRLALREDIEHVVSDYGPLVSVKVAPAAQDEVSSRAGKAGDVLLRFDSRDAAQRALRALDGREFAGATLSPVLLGTG